MNKRLPQIPDTDNLKLLISASMEFAVKDVDINFKSALNTSGSICRRISLNRSGCPLLSVDLLHDHSWQSNTDAHILLYCISEKQYDYSRMSGRSPKILGVKGVQPGQ